MRLFFIGMILVLRLATFAVEETPFQNLRGVMSPEVLREEDFHTLREWNANLLRRQFIRNWNMVDTDLDLEEFDQWIEKECDLLDRDLEFAEKYGIGIVLDLHTAPGGRLVPDRRMRMFYEQKYADHFVVIWERLAERYKGRKNLIAFDLINEPVTGPDAPIDWRGLQERAARAIRAVDPDRTIIVEVDGWCSAARYTGFQPLDLDNVVYQAHLYEPHAFTHQGVGNPDSPRYAYPGIINGERWDRERLRETLRPVRDFQLRYHVPVYIGEFSAVVWAEGADRYLADCVALFEEYQWSWSYHAFREWSGWSLEHAGHNNEDLVLSPDNPRKRVILEAFQRNTAPVVQHRQK